MVYLALQRHYNAPKNQPHNKTIAIQKCGNYPYEISLRFAGCQLKCGACYSASYSWHPCFINSNRVVNNKTINDLVNDYNALPTGQPPYNWMRIVGGEPLKNQNYVDFLFNFLKSIQNTHIFNNKVIIQTNGIYLGQELLGNQNTNFSNILKQHLNDLKKIHPQLQIVIEISIKGSNANEFQLISQSNPNLFQYNIGVYNALKNLNISNLRPTVVAGFGINESLLLPGSRVSKNTRILTILNSNRTPIFHNSGWSPDFKNLYNDFLQDCKNRNINFQKMPMHGFDPNSGWGRNAIVNAKKYIIKYIIIIF
ncbi:MULTISPECIES: 4Fe-4S cluster-binding domain-containing protein [Thermodesulfovibrio]|uniref:4Fe-4S cluster-binding domain-containing protein n=1 Tax=Thermodesulfovibrio TaxID=28261 RepID=UPI00260262A8|nr:4Fe-4S cluster-binding domain-containing protein [Thermodesulfovibrio sp.]